MPRGGEQVCNSTTLTRAILISALKRGSKFNGRGSSVIEMADRIRSQYFKFQKTGTPSGYVSKC